MNEAIEKVLNDETLTTTEEKVEAIKKGLATLVIPKDKYNDVSAKLKTTESNYQTLQSDYDEFKKSKMTDDEKIKAERDTLAEERKANAIARSELAVKGLLLDNGIKVTDEDVELKETLSNIISEDTDKSVKLANSFISLLNKTKDETARKTTTDLLNETPKPIGGANASNSVSTVDQLNAELQKAIENKDTLAQVSIMRKLSEEQNKPLI